ncbi:MAG: NifU family protein [Lentisphaeria bacterium]|nr:NifU family protein [Lentisphaeria bacterium]
MEELEKEIRERLDLLRGALQNDGGDLECVAVEGKVVKVRLRGACGCCPHAMATLKGYIQQDLNETIDADIEVERVE